MRKSSEVLRAESNDVAAQDGMSILSTAFVMLLEFGSIPPNQLQMTISA